MLNRNNRICYYLGVQKLHLKGYCIVEARTMARMKVMDIPTTEANKMCVVRRSAYMNDLWCTWWIWYPKWALGGIWEMDPNALHRLWPIGSAPTSEPHILTLSHIH